MEQLTLESLAKRVEALEIALASSPLSRSPKDWRRVVGMFHESDFMRAVDEETSGCVKRSAKRREMASVRNDPYRYRPYHISQVPGKRTWTPSYRTTAGHSCSQTNSDDGHRQSSSVRPGTRLNSFVLCVTNVRPWARAIVAIIKSFGPIGVP
jgi:hypothetical protein